MSAPCRRVVFNPTSIPELRQNRNYTQLARKLPRKPANNISSGWRMNFTRNESTAVGKDYTGHIEAHENEAILFFDSMLLSKSRREVQSLI